MQTLLLSENSIDNCTKCTICNDNCPVYKVNPAFPGPKKIAVEIQRFGAIPPSSCNVDFCTNCSLCTIHCPSGIKVNKLMTQVKSLYPLPRKILIRNALLSNFDRVGNSTTFFYPIINILSRFNPIKYIFDKILSISAKRCLPQFASLKLSKINSKLKIEPDGQETSAFQSFNRQSSIGKPQVTSRKILYYPGCYVKFINPSICYSAIKILKNFPHSNIEIYDGPCCGIPALANANMSAAKIKIKQNIEKLLVFCKEGYDIVSTCPSCVLALRKEYLEIIENKDTIEISKRTLEIFEYLEQKPTIFSLLTIPENLLHEKLLYHQPCHLKTLGTGQPAVKILSRHFNLNIENLTCGCCGMSGTYGLKKEKYSTSINIGQNLFEAINTSEKQILLTECGSCAMQINEFTKKKTMHPIQIFG